MSSATDRVLVALAILLGAGVLWLAWQGVKAWLRRGIRVQASPAADGRPALIYFSSPDCAPCRLQQSPIVAALEQELGDRVRFEEYDATAHPALAQQYRVLTVPTTVVVAPGGRVVAINYGVTPAGRLLRQIQEGAPDEILTPALR